MSAGAYFVNRKDMCFQKNVFELPIPTTTADTFVGVVGMPIRDTSLVQARNHVTFAQRGGEYSLCSTFSEA
jgi:hypothetical protein